MSDRLMLPRRTMLAGGLAGGLALAAGPALAAPSYDRIDKETVVYASPGGKDLVLDLYLPQGARRPLPVIVFLHGGGWSGGTRTTGPDFRRFFARDGFAMASIEYRLTPAGVFPNSVEDVKTAIRWLRANAGRYGLDSRRIGLWGTSAGGTLANLAGLSPKGQFEGEGNLAFAGPVTCVLDAYGPVKFDVMDAQTAAEAATLQKQPPALLAAPPMIVGVVQPAGAPRPAAARPAGAAPGPALHDAPNSAESRLLGAPVQTVPDRVAAASALTYVKADAPPYLIMHGMADNSVPHGQSVMLYEALAKAGNNAQLRLIDGLPHTFFNRTNLDELAGPYRMDVRTAVRGRAERTAVETAGVFDVARAFFTTHLRG